MEQTLPSNVPLTKSDFDNSRWTEVLDGVSDKKNHSYRDAFFAKAKEALVAGDQKRASVFTLLSDVTSFHFKPEKKDEPFGPMFVMQNGRSAIVDDLTDDRLALLKTLLPEIVDPELRSRISDVLWLTKRDHEAAERAVEAYLLSAKRLQDPADWVYGFERIERAVRLAASLERDGDSFKQAVAHAEQVLDQYQGDDPLYLSGKLMELLIEHGVGDPHKYIALSEKVAKKAEAERDESRAQYYWTINASWRKKAGDFAGERTAKVAAAETHVREAQAALQGPQPSHLVASNHLQKAIEAYRRLGNCAQKVEELHHLLLEYQQKSMSEMRVISSKTVNISDSVQIAINEVKGKPFQEAVLRLAILGSPPEISKLRVRVQDQVRQFPLQHLVKRMDVNNAGKVVARPPSMFSNSKDEVEAAILSEMFKTAVIDQQVHVQAGVDPVRNQIYSEHNPRMSDVMGLIVDNQFVPPGREWIFSRGLHAGFDGDWPEVAHFLIPQIENSVRYLLERKGVICSGLNSEGIQEEFDLNSLLRMPGAEDLFGKDLCFDLRGLLIERMGSNLRNRQAHGLIDQEGFFSASICYFWWLVLRIICWPILVQSQSQAQSTTAESPGGEDAPSH